MKFPTMIKKVILRILCKNHNFWTTSSHEKPLFTFTPCFILTGSPLHGPSVSEMLHKHLYILNETGNDLSMKQPAIGPVYQSAVTTCGGQQVDQFSSMTHRRHGNLQPPRRSCWWWWGDWGPMGNIEGELRAQSV